MHSRVALLLCLATGVQGLDTLTKHTIEAGGKHCDEIQMNAPLDDPWWRSNSWRYDSWAPGSCPDEFNYANEVDKLGSQGLHRLFGIRASGPNLGGIPTKAIAPGVEMPMVGIGTWLYSSNRSESAVLSALRLGYVAIDTAHDYANQDGIGRALKRSGRERTSYFLTSKVEGGLSYSDTLQAMEENLQQLGVDYVDLLLIHFPTTMAPPITGNSTTRQQQWKAMEQIHRAGKARAIGTSHFCQRQMEDILSMATVKPAVNQVEFHVGMGSAGGNATDDRAFMEKHGITFQSFSPLCGPCGAPGNKTLLTGAVVTGIGKKHMKSGAQVSLKWQVQQGIPVIPKTDNEVHLAQNLDLFDWNLTEEEMKVLSQADSPAAAGGGGDGTSGDCPLP